MEKSMTFEEIIISDEDHDFKISVNQSDAEDIRDMLKGEKRSLERKAILVKILDIKLEHLEKVLEEKYKD